MPGARPLSVSGDRLDHVLRRFTAHLGADGSVGGALCATCVDVLDLPGAGIMLRAGDGTQGTWSVSAGTMTTLEELEHTLGEGPCVDAYAQGTPVLEPDLANPAEPRWVGFTAAAVAAGAGAAFGFPLAIGGVRIGSLNLYAERAGALTEEQRQANQLRSTLREFFPGALIAFDDLASGDALAVLAVAPTPALGRTLSRSKIASALRRSGRQRRVEERAMEIQAALRSPQLEAPKLVAEAMGASVRALVGVLGELGTQVGRLEAELADRFEQHPDAKVIRSLPGLGMVLGARVLGEFGDDPNRYADAKSRKNYAGTSPITRASGARRVVLARFARNRRLADASYLWAFAALQASPGARAFYDEHRAAGDTHHRALRALANRLVGILHGCLRHGTPYDEHTAWGHRIPAAAA